MVAVDAIVVCFQSTPNFPSWHPGFLANKTFREGFSVLSRLGLSFDAWVYGEWVREVSFRHFDEALRRVPSLVREYLTTGRAQFVH